MGRGYQRPASLDPHPGKKAQGVYVGHKCSVTQNHIALKKKCKSAFPTPPCVFGAKRGPIFLSNCLVLCVLDNHIFFHNTITITNY